MSVQTIARRYATALADVVIKQGEARAVHEELSEWESMTRSNSLLQEVFRNPTIPYDQKRNLLKELIARTKVRQTTANFLQVLLRNQRLTELSEVNKKFAQILDERSGVVSVEVTTARPVAEESKAALNKKLMDLTGKSVRLTFTTDEELISGMVTRIGSTVYDGSVRNQLHELEETMSGK